jgi:hypothetical protein
MSFLSQNCHQTLTQDWAGLGDLDETHDFVPTGPRLSNLNPLFLSGQDFGFWVKMAKICPERGLASKGVFRGPVSGGGNNFVKRSAVNIWGGIMGRAFYSGRGRES